VKTLIVIKTVEEVETLSDSSFKIERYGSQGVMVSDKFAPDTRTARFYPWSSIISLADSNGRDSIKTFLGV
jgi:hypothetical protein